MRMLNPVHPGTFLRAEFIEAHGLSVTEAAGILRVSRPTLSSLLNAKAKRIQVPRYRPQAA
jgi:plasmid maintenance system antidote protein VapI